MGLSLCLIYDCERVRDACSFFYLRELFFQFEEMRLFKLVELIPIGIAMISGIVTSLTVKL